MKKLWFILLLLPTYVTAQKQLSIEQAVPGNPSYLAPERLEQVQFQSGNTATVTYVQEVNGQSQLLSFDGKESRTLISLSELNEKVAASKGPSAKRFPMVSWQDQTHFSFYLQKKKYSYDLGSKQLLATGDTSLTHGLENAMTTPDGKQVIYTREKNIYIMKKGAEYPVTSNGKYKIIYGESASRNEFGINGGLFMSPTGTHFAFYRIDQSDVTDYPIINWNQHPAKNENIKYPFAGDKSQKVSLGLYDLQKMKIYFVQTEGDPEQYLTNIEFSPDGKFVYIAVVNRAQNEMNLNEYEVSTGKFTHTLFTEKDEKYVEPMHPMQFVPGNPKQFIWRSNRDGYQHLYLYDISGKLIRQLTKGKWEVKSLNGFSKDGKRFFFHANMTSPIDQNFCSVDLKGKVVNHTPDRGFHSCSLNEEGTFAIDVFSNPSVPRLYSVVDLKKNSVTKIFEAKDPLNGYQKGDLKMFSIKNNAGDDLYCRMFYPVGFDSTKKYPVVVYLYNGPHSQLVTNSWLGGADNWYHYMAGKGYIVFTLDGRGTDNRGKKFSQAIHRQLGAVEMEDQLTGVNFLKGKRFVDADRMGVFGWSFGGFMTSSLMTRYAGTFKVGVAGGPVIDWRYYEIMYGERYMDTPQENPEGYKENNVLNHIGKLKDHLLVIHGTDDNVVVWQHSLMLLQKSVAENVQLDYYVYPGHEHNVRGKDRMHLIDKVSSYLMEHLK